MNRSVFLTMVFILMPFTDRNKIADQPMSVVGEDGFGMKLDPVDGINEVVDGHDRFIFGSCIHFQTFRQIVVIED